MFGSEWLNLIHHSLTCHVCKSQYVSQANLEKHIVQTHGHFLYARDVALVDVQCKQPDCKYEPDSRVMDPAKCLRAHERRVHKLYARPYIIREEP